MNEPGVRDRKPPVSTNPVFDRLFDEAIPRVLGGTHNVDEQPVDGGRWPVTVVANGMPAALLSQLNEKMLEAVAFAGPDHFLTGRIDSAHITVRALEPYRDAATASDDSVRAWAGAMARTAAGAAPFFLECTGLTLTAGGIMAQLEPHDSKAWELMDRLACELGDGGWYEAALNRNIWYSNILHFAASIDDPAGLVDWIAQQRLFGERITFAVTGLSLVRSHYIKLDNGSAYMRPEYWQSANFAMS